MGQAELELSPFFDKHDDVQPLHGTRELTRCTNSISSSWPIDSLRELGFVDDDDLPLDEVAARPFVTEDGELGLLLPKR